VIEALLQELDGVAPRLARLYLRADTIHTDYPPYYWKVDARRPGNHLFRDRRVPRLEEPTPGALPAYP
jgi:hypothetical protein